MNSIADAREPRKKISVLLVDDSALALAALGRMLAAAEDIVVAGTARNGLEALRLIPSLDPMVVCTDLHMPVMDGRQLTRNIMSQFPRPILVISVSASNGKGNAFQLLQEGALDVFRKPRSGGEADYFQGAQELAAKIRILAGVHVFRKPLPPSAPPAPGGRSAEPPRTIRIVAIGASTGGPQALYAILSRLPAGYPYPLVCVQHISTGFMAGLVEWLASVCALPVRIAGDGELPAPGTVYFPRDGAHLTVDANGMFRYSAEAPREGHLPSITVTFESLAARFGGRIVAVLLTGMGGDGVEGMLSVARAGGVTIAQDEESSLIFGMPKRAIEAKAAQMILSLEEIAARIAAGVF